MGKNKKKKNKVATEEDGNVNNGASDQQHRVPDAAEDRNGGGAVNSDRHRSNGAETSSLIEAEKQQWVQREKALQETIEQLRRENDSHVQLQATLEEKVKQLQCENDSHVQIKDTLEEKVKDLQYEKDLCVQKGATLEETIRELREANNSCIQKEGSLEGKIDQLLNEKAALGLKLESLDEKNKQVEDERIHWTQIEDKNKETIARMNVDITRLRMQVVELEESRNSLLKEHQQSLECIASLQMQLQNLETNGFTANKPEEAGKPGSEREDLNSQIEASLVLVDRLIMENAELVEKVNELYIKLERQSAVPAVSSAVESDSMSRNSGLAEVAIPLSESNDNIFVMDRNSESMELKPGGHFSYASESDSGEIVQIPLDDTEARNVQLQAAESDEIDEIDPVPLTDAPLIGAPFRLISFVAKYVSGADLVNKDAVSS